MGHCSGSLLRMQACNPLCKSWMQHQEAECDSESVQQCGTTRLHTFAVLTLEHTPTCLLTCTISHSFLEAVGQRLMHQRRQSEQCPSGLPSTPWSSPAKGHGVDPVLKECRACTQQNRGSRRRLASKQPSRHMGSSLSRTPSANSCGWVGTSAASAFEASSLKDLSQWPSFLQQIACALDRGVPEHAQIPQQEKESQVLDVPACTRQALAVE